MADELGLSSSSGHLIKMDEATPLLTSSAKGSLRTGGNQSQLLNNQTTDIPEVIATVRPKLNGSRECVSGIVKKAAPDGPQILTRDKDRLPVLNGDTNHTPILLDNDRVEVKDHHCADVWSCMKNFLMWFFGILFTAVLIIVFGLLLYDFSMYLQYVGDPQRILQFIGYEQFNMQLILPVAIICFSTIYLYLKPWIVKTALNLDDQKPIFSLQEVPNFLFNKYVNLRDILLGLMLFIAPIVNMVIMGFAYKEARDEQIANHTDEDYPRKCINTMIYFRSGEIPGIFIYGWLTFIIYLHRKKYQNIFVEAATRIIEDAYTIENCKADITKKWLEIHEYRNVVGWWLCYTITIVSLALTTQIRWLSAPEFAEFAAETASKLIQVAMAGQNIMLLVQSLFVVGGFDVDTIWHQFEEQFKKNYKKSEHQQYLQVILKHMKKMHSRGPWFYTTVVFAIGTIFAAFSFPVQFAHFWVRPNCSLNEMSPTISPNTMF